MFTKQKKKLITVKIGKSGNFFLKIPFANEIDSKKFITCYGLQSHFSYSFAQSFKSTWKVKLWMVPKTLILEIKVELRTK